MSLTAEEISLHPKPEGLKSIPGTLAIHSVRIRAGTPANTIEVRALSCCCNPCMGGGNHAACLNKAWVGTWQLKFLVKGAAARRRSKDAEKGEENELELEALDPDMPTVLTSLTPGAWVAVSASSCPNPLPQPIAARPHRGAAAAAKAAVTAKAAAAVEPMYGLVQLELAPFVVPEPDSEEMTDLREAEWLCGGVFLPSEIGGELVVPGETVFKGLSFLVLAGNVEAEEGMEFKMPLDLAPAWFRADSVLMAAARVEEKVLRGRTPNTSHLCLGLQHA
jgi:hypothetical protein